jgi:hypothetical protein
MPDAMWSELLHGKVDRPTKPAFGLTSFWPLEHHRFRSACGPVEQR